MIRSSLAPRRHRWAENVNPFSTNGKVLTVHGTSGDDTFSFVAGSNQFTLNGVAYTFNPTGVTTVKFNGNGGKDTATLTGTSSADRAYLSPRSGKLLGTGYEVDVSGVANIVVHGGGGSDCAYLYDAAGNNTFVGTSTYSYLTGTGYDNEVVGFKTVVAYHTAGSSDVAYLYHWAGSTFHPHVHLQLPDRRRLAGRGRRLPDSHRGVGGPMRRSRRLVAQASRLCTPAQARRLCYERCARSGRSNNGRL